MMKPLRFGIVGCGGISHLHAQCLQKLEVQGIAALVAGAEIDPQRGEAWSAKWKVPVYASLERMLAETQLDAVTVATPSGLHGDCVLQCAAAGKHVLCEKPLDLDLAKADAALAAARKHGVTLGGIFQQRFAPGPRRAKRAIDQGAFGRIVLVHAETPWHRTQQYYSSGAWRGTWALDGGVLANQSPHMIDRLLWLGGDVAQVTAADLRCGLERDIEAETVAVVTLRLANGALGTITATTLAYDGMPQRVLICGTEGSAAFEGDTLTFFKTSRPWHDDDDDALDHHPSVGDGAGDPLAISSDGHLGNIRDFATAVQQGRQPSVTGDDARRVVRVLNMIYDKAQVGPRARCA